MLGLRIFRLQMDFSEQVLLAVENSTLEESEQVRVCMRVFTTCRSHFGSFWWYVGLTFGQIWQAKAAAALKKVAAAKRSGFSLFFCDFQ